MSETRVKVYRTPAEMAADEADAARHGWAVIGRDPLPDGTMRVTFAMGRAFGGGIVGPAPANTAPSLLGLALILVVVITAAVLFGFGR